MLHELFITHCTNGTLIMNPFTFINKCVYLPKMPPLKWGVGEFGMFWILEMCREVYSTMGVKREGTPMGKYLPRKLHVPPHMLLEDDLAHLGRR